MSCLTEDQGTCNDGRCKFHGWCHCGCGRAAFVTPQTRANRRWTRGKPLRWVAGHSPGSRANYQFLAAARPAGPIHRYDIPIERVRPLAVFVHRRAGTIPAAAVLCGLSYGTFNHILYGRKAKGVTPQTAEHVVSAVLAIRGHLKPDAWHQPRFPTPFEQGLVDDPTVVRNRLTKRRERAAKRKVSA